MPAKNIINTAIKTAKESVEDFQLSAVLFKGGSVIRARPNSIKSIAYRKNIFPFEPTRHAEISVIHNIPRDVLKECSILVVRIDCNEHLVCGKPCKSCITALQKAGISKLYYSDYEGNIIKINPSYVDLNEWEKEIPNNLV